MSGALLGFRIDGENKLMRLHGELGCEGVLLRLQGYLSRVSAARLRAYARTLKKVALVERPFTDDADQALLQSFFEDHFGETCRPQTWAEALAAFPELDGWHAGFPYMAEVKLESCGDVIWGFLIDLDADALQIFVNRNARFQWRDIAGTQPAYCTLPLAHLAELTAGDLSALNELLQHHSYSDGIDPVLPLCDAVSTGFAGPGRWQARLQLTRGRVRLLLARGPVQARMRQLGELRLDDPHCGPLLHEALDPAVRALALAIHGPAVSVGQVAQVAARITQLPYAPDAGGLPLLGLGLSPGCGLPLRLGPGFFDEVRACFLAAGMTTQGWRFLVKQDNTVLRHLLGFFPPSARILGGFAHFINLLASALQSERLISDRCQPALRGMERILDRTRGRPDPIRQENARIFLRAIMRARLTAEELANLDHEAQDVSDYVYSQSVVLKGATWVSLCRRSDTWHRALLISVDPLKDVRWTALLPHFAMGDYLAVELDCGFLLAEEGLEQRHCIGTYVNACSSGASRVFSLRRQGRRTATIELQRGHDGGWHMVQIRGKANSVIEDPAVLAAGEALARAYAQAARSELQDHAGRGHQALQPGAYVSPGYLIHRQEHWTG
jgi:hypothetical protein